MASSSYPADSHIKARQLASAILSSSSPHHISSVCSAIESFFHKHVPDQTRSFFAVAFPALICKMFGFDDSASPHKPQTSGGGWIDQILISNDTALAGKLYQLLSPSGILLSSIFAVDRHSLVKYVYPVERLPQWARFVLQSERDPSILADLCPLFRGRLKEDPVQGVFQVQLNVFEYYLFWFAYYPVCKGSYSQLVGTAVKRSRGFKLESWASTFPVLATAARLPGQKIECNLYLRLLYAYLRSFVPNYGLNSYQPYRSSLLHYSSTNDIPDLSQAEFLVNTFIHFWLVDCDVSPMPLNACHSLNLSSSFRKDLGETPPPAGLGETVSLLVKYLNTNVVLGKEGVGMIQNNRTQKLRFLGSAESLKSRAEVSLFPCGNCVGSWNILIQRPLYRFILRTFLYCPIGASIKDASQIFSVWAAYLEPWKINLEEFAEFDALEPGVVESLKGESCQSPAKASTVDRVYQSQHWQDYVESNYLFYNSLVVQFFGFAHKFLHSNVETILQMVLKVLNILTSSYELMELLKKIDVAYHSKQAGTSSAMLDSSYRYVPSIQEQQEDWEDGLCESNVAVSLLHENWNKDLKLFSGGEDGGHQLLQLLISRAEHEFQAISAQYLIKNQQTLDSLKTRMGILFGGEAAKPPLVVPEPTHNRDEIFTPKHPGWGKRTWADVKYKGDWMRRPISDGEVAWLARLLISLSVWLNDILGLENAENIHAVSVCAYADLPGDDTEHVGGLKEALSMVLYSVWLWFVFIGQVVLRFMREHGLRINLRVFASKKFVMFLISYAIFSLWRKACGFSLHPSAMWVSLVP